MAGKVSATDETPCLMWEMGIVNTEMEGTGTPLQAPVVKLMENGQQAQKKETGRRTCLAPLLVVPPRVIHHCRQM
jgi:hypothetical protein